MLRVGTRASKLARWQADWVAAQLRDRGVAVEIVELTTRGDADVSTPIADIGAPGVFTKAIQTVLLAGKVDLAVHSLKDLPTDVVEGLMLAAVPVRESAADVLVAKAAATIADLPLGARVGTGSLRRQAQLRHLRPDLQVMAVRGNVDTRLRKLDEGECDALILAEAGLKRLGLASRIVEILPARVMMSAVGQGALGIECRVDDARTQAEIRLLDDWASRVAVMAERALLAHLKGGCLAPIGAWGRMENGRLQLSAVVLDAEGTRRIEASNGAVVNDARDAAALGCLVANALLAQGASELIATSRKGQR